MHVGIDINALTQPSIWPNQAGRGGIGGQSTYYHWPALYGVRHDDGRQQTLSGKIDIAKPEPHNQSFPSLLGWDVLQEFRVVTDWGARQITLG